MDADTESNPSEDLRAWIERILGWGVGLEFQSFRISKTSGPRRLEGRPRTYQTIASVPAPRVSRKFIMPDDMGYVIGYCIAVADLDLRVDDQRVYYRIKSRGKNAAGTFENSKHFMRTSHEAGASF